MADVAYNTGLSWGGTSIPNVTSFTGPSLSAEAVDVTDLNDTARAYIAANLYDAGEVTLDINFEADNSLHDQMADDLIAGTERAFVVTFQNGTNATTSWSCNALVTAFTPSGNVGEALKASVTLKATGGLNIT